MSDVPQTLTVWINDEAVDQFEVADTFSRHTITLPHLTDELVKVRLQSDNPASPVWVTQMPPRGTSIRFPHLLQLNVTGS